MSGRWRSLSTSSSSEPVPTFASLRSQLGIPAAWPQPELPFAPQHLPPLPPIPYPALARQATLHRSADSLRVSTATGQRERSAYEREVYSYERLEGLGDRRLASVVYAHLMDEFPDLNPSLLGSLTSILVANSTLAWLAVAYDLPSHLEFSGREGLPAKLKICADLFEAHVGALDQYERQSKLDSGLDNWLAGVFSVEAFPTLASKAASLLERVLHSRNKGGPAVPSSTAPPSTRPLGRRGWECVRCDSGYADLVTRPTTQFDPHDHQKGWHAKLYLDEQFLGCGVGKTKTEATEVAKDLYIGASKRAD
ncbi:hypothetical protein JCM10207_003035 [Rhodosporidiobolus poonsookiae]